jgi:NADH-quinone oxidoreductase subunit G
VPVVGEDDTYPKGRRGQPIQPVKFTIRAEKCPNRKGVEKVLAHFQSSPTSFDQVIKDAGEGKLEAVYLAASCPPRPAGWLNETQVEALKKVPAVICQDLLPSAVSAFASIVLPGASWAEKEGTLVNHAGLAQAIHWAVTPTGECRTDGQVFLDLLERRGLAHAPSLRKELAEEIRWFAPLAGGEVDEYGISLETGK